MIFEIFRLSFPKNKAASQSTAIIKIQKRLPGNLTNSKSIAFYIIDTGSLFLQLNILNIK
ncbi:hypothetical protein HMPREF1548_04734 [Clostridium sp. KLE 1755]|nr:hypothetical protein HMPREF1548_04734 [Clostridium sp. KLE 1755]